MEEFYKQFPDFDWKFYVSCYNDLKNANINTETKAVIHYHRYGQYENRRSHCIISPQNIVLSAVPATQFILAGSQCHVSNGLHMFESRFREKFQLLPYENKDNPCYFFGVYDDRDLCALRDHKGLKTIIWGGEDVNLKHGVCIQTLKEIAHLHNIIHCAISKSIYERLQKCRIPSVYIDFNLVNRDIFRPVSKKGCHIFIYNGHKPGREHIYGKHVYEEVMLRLPQYGYVLSNLLNVPYEKMHEVYSTCFIMLRLTENDGNANSVQECEAMQIPVIHNHSDYGLSWKSVDHIVQIILEHNPKRS